MTGLSNDHSDPACFERGGVCNCGIGPFGRECGRYLPPRTIASTGTGRADPPPDTGLDKDFGSTS